MSANPSGTAKKYCVPNVIGITNSRLHYIIQHMVNDILIGVESEIKAKCACLPHHFLWAAALREQLATGNGIRDELYKHK